MFCESNLKNCALACVSSRFCSWSDCKNGKTRNVAKSLSLVGEEAFLVTLGCRKKSSKKEVRWTKNGNWKGARFGSYRDSFEAFFRFVPRRKTRKLQRFHKFRSRKNMSQRCQNCVNIDVFGGRGARNAANIALLKKHRKYRVLSTR